MDWKAVKSLQTTGSEAAAKDDEPLTSLLKVVCDALPFPLRPLVKQDVFLRYCLKSRDKLLSAAA